MANLWRPPAPHGLTSTALAALVSFACALACAPASAFANTTSASQEPTPIELESVGSPTDGLTLEQSVSSDPSGLDLTDDEGQVSPKNEIQTSPDELFAQEHSIATAGTADKSIASGTWGTCPWEIDAQGVLTVRPGTGADTTSETSPWIEYAQSITSIVFASEGTQKVVLPARSDGLLRGLANAKTADLTGADASRVTTTYQMFYGCSSLTSIDLTDWQTSALENMGGMFWDCKLLTEIKGLAKLDTSSVTSLWGVFIGCSSLEALDLSSWDVSKATDLQGTFSGCSSLKSLDLTGWSKAQPTRVSILFSGCSSLTTLDLSSWYTSNATDMYGAFSGCSQLEKLDLSGWDTSSATSMSQMFTGCSELAALDVSGWNTSSATNMSQMFTGCAKLAALDVSSWDTSSATNMSQMFSGCSELAALDVSGWDTSLVTDMYLMFYDCANLAALDVSSWNTSSATLMWGMFWNCKKLTSLDPSGWDTSAATKMSTMFYNCPKLKKLDLSGWDTSRVADVSAMFSGCTDLVELDISGWNMASVSDAAQLLCDCSSLKLLRANNVTLGSGGISFFHLASLEQIEGTSNWDTSRVTDMSSMFNGCSKLTALDLSGWHTSQVTEMGDMFYGCSSLVTLNISGWDAFAVTDASLAFAACPKLTSIDLTGWSADKGMKTERLFEDCSSLAKISLGANNSMSHLLPTYKINGFEGWYSESLHEVLSSEDVAARQDVADTYTKGRPAGSISFGSRTTISVASCEYDGTAKRPEPTVTLVSGGKQLTIGEDFWVSYANNVDKGAATVTAHGWGDYCGTLTATFEITNISLLNAEVDAIGAKTFNGRAHKPTPRVRLRGTLLTQDKDYRLTYANNVNAGTATLTIEGRGDYMDSKTIAFVINKASSSVSLTNQTTTYAEEAQPYEGPVTRRGSGGNLTFTYFSNAACTKAVAEANVKNAGTYYVRAHVAADKNYAEATSAPVKLTIKKDANGLYARAKTRTAKYAKVKKKSVVLYRPLTISDAHGKVTYKVAKWVTKAAKKRLSLNKKTGKVTVKKGTPKKTYTFKVKVTAAGDANHKAASKTITCKIKVA